MWWLAAPAGLLALLSVPVNLSFRAQGFDAAFTVSWLFGLVRFPLKRSGGTKKARKARPRKSGNMAWPLLRDARFRERGIRLLRDVLGALRPGDVHMRLRLGFDDPADTGLLWGALAFAPQGAIDAAPDFSGETFEWDVRGRVRFIPAQLAGLILGFVLSPAVLRAVWRANVDRRAKMRTSSNSRRMDDRAYLAPVP